MSVFKSAAATQQSIQVADSPTLITLTGTQFDLWTVTVTHRDKTIESRKGGAHAIMMMQCAAQSTLAATETVRYASESLQVPTATVYSHSVDLSHCTVGKCFAFATGTGTGSAA